MNILEILVAARALIEKPENWANKDTWQSDGHFCAYRAVEKASGHRYSVQEMVLEVFREANGFDLTGSWNDSHTHAEVLAAFDKAIEAKRAAVTSAYGDGK